MANTNSKDSSFKLPASSLDEVFKVVQGYTNVGVGKKASLADISKNTGIHRTTVSKNVGFLLSLGILEGGRDKAITAVGSKLGLALMHEVPEEIESILSEIVSKDEFLKNILAAVRIRKGMDDSSLRAHIAYSAGQSKTGSTTTGTGAVVELLKRSGHLQEEDGKLIVRSPIARTSSQAVAQESRVERIPSPAPLRTVTRTIEAASPFSISIKIEVQCGPNDLNDLGEKLRKVVDDFSNVGADNASEE